MGRQLRPSDAVYSREVGKQQKWRQGVIATQTGPVSYTVLLDDDHEVHRHQDHVIRRETPEENGNDLTNTQWQVTKQRSMQLGTYPQRE